MKNAENAALKKTVYFNPKLIFVQKFQKNVFTE